ncbi:MAG: hypothetical protein HC828_17615, partial [Blastochloris sp.]|nr:hypothetical protein [Blastochloris sp.]
MLHLGRRGSFRQRQRANGTDYIVAVGNDPPHTLAQLWPTLAAQHQAVPWQWVVALSLAVVSGTLSVIGNGVVLDPWALRDEVAKVEGQGVSITDENLAIADNCPLILPLHRD